MNSHTSTHSLTQNQRSTPPSLNMNSHTHSLTQNQRSPPPSLIMNSHTHSLTQNQRRRTLDEIRHGLLVEAKTKLSAIRSGGGGGAGGVEVGLEEELRAQISLLGGQSTKQELARCIRAYPCIRLTLPNCSRRYRRSESSIARGYRKLSHSYRTAIFRLWRNGLTRAQHVHFTPTRMHGPTSHDLATLAFVGLSCGSHPLNPPSPPHPVSRFTRAKRTTQRASVRALMMRDPCMMWSSGITGVHGGWSWTRWRICTPLIT